MFKDIYNWSKSLKINVTATLLAASTLIIGPLTVYMVKNEMGKVTEVKESVDDLRDKTTTEIKSLKEHVDASLTDLKISQEDNLKDFKQTTEKQFQATNAVLSNHIITTEKDAKKIQESINRLYQFSWDIKKNDSSSPILFTSTEN